MFTSANRATDAQIKGALMGMAKVKRPTNVSTAEDVGMFYAIYINALNEFSIDAIRGAVNFFITQDPRLEENKPFFPQPDEMIKACKEAQESIDWRAKHAGQQAIAAPVKKPEEQSPQSLERQRLKLVCDDMTKAEVLAACEIIRTSEPRVDAFEASAIIKRQRTA